jgi:hypothetical protein
MNDLGKLFSAMGSSRAEHAANIEQMPYMREEYAKLHNAVFEKNGLDKYVVVDVDGKIVNHAASPKAAKALLTNANGTVRHEDFLVIQDKIVEVRRRALNGIADLMAGGLSFGVGIGEQLVGFENVNEFQEAEQQMNPSSYQNNDTVFTETYVPNPITHQSFSVPWRQNGFDYKRSLGLTESVRQVAEKLENTLFNGNAAISVNFGGQANPIYGYTTHPDRGTGTISDWSAVANIALIVPEAIEQIGLMWSSQGGVENDSVVMYVANDVWTNLQNDYKADSERSVMTRLLDIPQLKAIKPGEKLASTQVVLVEMLERTIQLATASDIITVPHIKTNPMAPQVLTTYAAMVQQIKSDSKGNTGVRHLTV